MSRLYWDSQFLSPFPVTTTMDHNPLKRSRSTESLERQFKRSKPFQIESIDSSLSVASESSPIATTITPTTAFSNTTLYPAHHHVHQQQEQQQQYQQYQQQHAFLKPISISTKTSDNPSLPPQAALVVAPNAVTRASPTDYENINGILYSAHVERFGDPETRESWWQETQDIEMDEEEAISNNEYNSANSVLRQAFLARRGQHERR